MMSRSGIVLCFALSLLCSQAMADSDYAAMSNEELIEQASRELTQEQRRALLTEIFRRASSQSEGLVIHSMQRRYGRTLRQPDGTIVRIERRQRVVHYRRAPAEAPEEADEGRAFGIGFERRLAELESAQGERDEAEEAASEALFAPAPNLPAIRADRDQR